MTETIESTGEPSGERVAKRIARSGLCSRRDAERLIAAGRVVVDGSKLDSPACLVTEASRILVDGKPLPAAEATRLWRYHKPRGLMTTHRDPQGRPTIFEKLPTGLPRVISIGRLDFNSEGLLLLTNDGALARRLELPATGWLRRYRVRVHGELDENRLPGLEKGIEIDGVRYGAIQATLDSRKGSNAWLTLSLREGKNREVRRVVEALGAVVTRLIRIAYGPFQLGYLEPSTVEEVPPRVMRDQLGAPDGKTDGKAGPKPSGASDRRRLRNRAADSKPSGNEPSGDKPSGKRPPGKKPWGKKPYGTKPADANRRR
jgi:23S rRNA pseudouridine2605 synthase